MIHVRIPSPLFPYTGGLREVEVEGESLASVLWALDAAYPGMRHRVIDEQDRIRKHIRFFVNGEMAGQLDRALGANDEVMIVAALSGG